MPLTWPGLLGSSRLTGRSARRWLTLALWSIFLAVTRAMTSERVADLRQETVEMFYHGFDNYMNVAFPEDELRPITCMPLTRDQQNPRNVELNDVLGNYSLTLIDSLSTLAILASSPPDRAGTGAKALRDFQAGVVSLVQLYGDGTSGAAGNGLRGHGFDVDSKVQVFETVIRGVGGLLSAHLFAAGALPISRYTPKPSKIFAKKNLGKGEIPAIIWPNGFKYDGQLLRLALDLAQRLLPAFYTATGLPYPRVNLRHGIPFYMNSPLHGADDGYLQSGPLEITETCSAGAGSLVLEFTVLSRLTDDSRFEQIAKRAFWAVWERRSSIGLIGAGVDAEKGHWIGSYAGIGAGTDSFFEYALKTHILLSGHEWPNFTMEHGGSPDTWLDPNTIYPPLTAEQNSPEAFLTAWHEAHAAVKRHLYSGIHHPHYVNVHLDTGSPQAYWIDSLGAYYPGLLAIAGELEEAVETHLLYTALWTRYAALPERWSVRDGQVEGGLGWWPGRPEFIESNYHLYRAMKDPWYLHVGEMALKDIKRRCWTRCGWAGLQDVRTGEQIDRMESFFLGETAKYLYLLFDTDHPLNALDAAYVFTTEGHPLLIPPNKKTDVVKQKKTSTAVQSYQGKKPRDICPMAPTPIPLTISATAARRDIFHAASLIGLHLIPNNNGIELGPAEMSYADSTVPNPTTENFTYYPWTLPEALMPKNGTCDRLPMKRTFTIEFPATTPLQSATAASQFIFYTPQNLLRVADGILVKSLSGLKVGMVYELPSPFHTLDGPLVESWRVWNIANMPLGRDEQIFVPRDVIGEMVDPSFTRVRDSVMLDLVIQIDHKINATSSSFPDELSDDDGKMSTDQQDIMNSGLAAEYKTLFSSILHSFTSILSSPTATPTPLSTLPETYSSKLLPAILPIGAGAAPFPDVSEAPDPGLGPQSASLLWHTVYFAGDACAGKLEDAIPKNYEILVLRRGGCTFADKLSHIPSFTPTAKSLKLVIVVSHEDDDEDDESGETDGHRLIRPLVDKEQVTPSGLARHNQVAMVMVGGGTETEQLLRAARGLGVRRRYHVESQGLVVGNIVVI